MLDDDQSTNVTKSTRRRPDVVLRGPLRHIREGEDDDLDDGIVRGDASRDIGVSSGVLGRIDPGCPQDVLSQRGPCAIVW